MIRTTTRTECSVDACQGVGIKGPNGRRYFVKGLCAAHYTRQANGQELDGSDLLFIRDGKISHPLYVTWSQMIQRCRDTKSPSYPDYGGRGIKVCDRWLGKYGFDRFVEDMGNKPSPDYSIDRKDVNGNYEPSNCRWATRTQQNINRRVFKNSSTGITGVSLDKRNGGYRATMTTNYKQKWLGTFSSIEEATACRQKAEGARVT